MLTALALLATALAHAQTTPTIAAKTAGMTKWDGYFPLYWDERNGKLYVEISRWNMDFLYVSSLPAGLGSNDVGLDRGQLGRTRVVRMERTGPKVLMVQRNFGYRASSNNVDERRAVAESFAESVIWGFSVEARDGDRVLVDATNFYLRDAHGVPERLSSSNQGTFRLDAARSALYLPRTKNFPKNTEVEATLTFSGERPGRYVRDVAPSPDSITLREHHSFIELPDDNYQPRTFDPRAGYFGTSFFDFATPVGDSIRKQYISRHRLQKKDPAAMVSESVKPIIYYVDRGAPEPIRSALLEGARWWDQAFTAAGYRNAFRVEVMPEGADSMDVRYNVIQWVHRSTRGWSYGASVTDPRTSEIIKGHVTLGSLRVRQDYLIAEGLLAPYEEGRPASQAMMDMALARLRQLSAHEVGHTLGLSHNYVSSASKGPSVMDYPHPWVELNGQGVPDLSKAYRNGIGEWDKVAITYGYSDSGATELRTLLESAYKRGVYYLTDADARPEGSAHPSNHLWDNGADAVAELRRLMEVRKRALERFSEKAIPVGRPMSTLQEPLVTTYLMHRYQVEAASKVLGGLEYTYALRGDGQLVTRMVDPAQQRKALDALLATLDPAALTLPERILKLLPPVAPGFARTREYFPSRTGLTFDAVSAAETAAYHTVRMMLHPERAARLIQQHARDAANPALEEVIDKLLSATWKRAPLKGLPGEAAKIINETALVELMTLASNEDAAPQARAIAMHRLQQLRGYLTGFPQDAHFSFAALRIRKFLEDPKPVAPAPPADAPPGMPIGMATPYCDAIY